MSSSRLIETKRKDFAIKYQQLGTPEDLAILAAVQHGYLYSPNLSNGEKLRIKNEWKKLLKEIGSKYQSQRTIEDFINDIQYLKRRMNEQFLDFFNNDNIGYENGFRIAHAQKSLSIYLKHCWCRKDIKPIPPACPIDGNVLKWVHVKQAWTKCNCIENIENIPNTGYRSQYDTIKDFVGQSEPKLSVFEWELCKWISDSEKTNNPQKEVKKGKGSSIGKDVSTSIISKNELNQLQERYPDYIISGKRHKINAGPYVELWTILKNGSKLAVGHKNFYFCGIYKNERNRNPYPDIFIKPVKAGYYKKFKSAQEALNQFEDILQKETGIQMINQLTKSFIETEAIPVKDLLANSVYYPACYDDGAPVKFFNKRFAEYGIQSYVYADYGMKSEDLTARQDGFLHYHIFATRELKESDLVSHKWEPSKYRQFLSEDEVAQMEEVSKIHEINPSNAFGRWIVYERDADADAKVGPEKFSLIYIAGDGAATYAALYLENKIAPKALAIIQPGGSFGGNYTSFYNPDGVFLKIVNSVEAKPEYVLTDDNTKFYDFKTFMAKSSEVYK